MLVSMSSLTPLNLIFSLSLSLCLLPLGSESREVSDSASHHLHGTLQFHH